MKGTVFIATSLDGYIATEDGDVSFLQEVETTETPNAEEKEAVVDDMGFGDLMSSIDAIIMGRNSFEKVLSFGKDMWAYGDKPIIVWTRRSNTLEIPDYLQKTVSCSSLSPKDLFAQLEKEKGYKHAYVDGGTTVQSFLRDGLIDDIKITQVPIILGGGIPLFGKLGKKIKLRYMSTKTNSSNGMVSTHYHVLK